MFQFLSNIKMKYKFIIICFLPFAVLLSFVGKLVYNDYMVIKQMNDDTYLMQIYDKAGSLLDVLGTENNLNAFKQYEVKTFTQSDLKKVRNEAQKLFQEIKQLIVEDGASIGDKKLEGLFQDFFANHSEIDQVRNKVDLDQLSNIEMAEFYAKIRISLISDLANAAQHISDFKLALSIFTYNNLLLERIAVDDERRILFEIISLKDFSQEREEMLLQSTGEQKAFQTVFFELGTDEQGEIYRRTVQGQAITESQRIRQQVLRDEGNEQLAIDPKTWWNVQTQKIELLHEVEDKLLQTFYEHINATIDAKSKELFLIILSICVALPLTAFLVVFSLRSIVKKLQEEIIILSNSGDEIKNSIVEVSAGTSESASSVMETTTTVEELKQTAQVASDKAQNVAQLSGDAIETLEVSEKTLEETIDGMHRIQNGMSTISESIIKLSENSQSIGAIIDTVNELAEQSHLLAVNAAIEAAKAGEHGKGFSVVAHEVRSLAEQSKQATVQVRRILNEIQNSTSAAVMATEQGTKAVENGVEKSNQVNESIQNLSGDIKKVVDASAQIALSSEQQFVGIKQVNVAMTNIREASKNHVEHMQQIEKSIEGMNAVGVSLKELVLKF